MSRPDNGKEWKCTVLDIFFWLRVPWSCELVLAEKYRYEERPDHVIYYRNPELQYANLLPKLFGVNEACPNVPTE